MDCQENRLAQVATVDQQRELMRYMADLNNWLARDVQDRQAEIRGVNARIENLRREVNNLATGRGMGEILFITLSFVFLNHFQPSQDIIPPQSPLPVKDKWSFQVKVYQCPCRSLNITLLELLYPNTNPIPAQVFHPLSSLLM